MSRRGHSGPSLDFTNTPHDQMTTTASLRRRLPLSPAAPPLEDDDLLSEILLRLPPLPSTLPRAAAVCTRWHGLLTDPAFHRRFRIHHHPPLIGFIDASEGITIHPALDAPDRLPRSRFSLNIDENRYRTLGCRHGLALFFLQIPRQLLVWDPVAGDLRRLAIPPALNLQYDPLVNPISGAVLRLRAAGDHFQVVLVGSEGKQQHRRALACVYSSETGVWGDFVSTPLPPDAMVFDHEPAVLAGDCLHWLILSASQNIVLEFHLDRQSLAVTSVPADMFAARGNRQFRVIRTHGGGMGFLYMCDFTAQLWTKETTDSSDGVVSWVRGTTIQLDKLFPPNSEKNYLSMVGYAEENNVVFFWTALGVFMLHLQSLQFKRTSETTNSCASHYPFELVYTPGIGVGHDGAKVVKHRLLTRWTQYIRRLLS